MNRKHSLILFVVVLTLLVSVGIANAQGPTGTGQPRSPRVLAGTAFTYQGQLKKNGTAVSATCNFQFGLFSDSGATIQIGSTQPVNNVLVANGLFTATIDFGTTAFTGDARWLRTAVQCPPDISFTPLSLQPITPAPMALALPGLYTQQNGTSPNVIGGYSGNGVLSGNTVMTGVYGATISGGGGGFIINQVTDYYGTVGGGSRNQAGDNDSILWNASFTTVSGGERNSASGDHATVGGGYGNTANGVGSVIAGGGATNFDGSLGYFGNTASGGGSTIGGGMSNDANGWFSTIPGGYQNTASFSYTLAAGHRAKANNLGTFVWADSTDTNFASTGDNQFLIRANGGVGVNTTNPANASLQVAKDFNGSGSYGQIEAIGATNNNKRMTMGFDTTNNIGWLQASESWSGTRDLAINPIGGNVLIGTTSGADRLTVSGDIRTGTSGTNGCVKRFDGTAIAGSCSSDARLKQNIVPFTSMLTQVSQLQPVHYSWRADEFPQYGFVANTQSYGLIAQEVERFLPELVGQDENGYKTVNYSELPLVMLQALKELRVEKDDQVASLQSQIDTLQKENATLKQQNASIESRLSALEQNASVHSSANATFDLNLFAFGILLIGAMMFYRGRK